MIGLRLFLDTNLFLSYATDFEKTRNKSERLFHGIYERFSGIRVTMELNKIKKRRSKLYKDLLNFYSKNPISTKYNPSVSVKKNDRAILKH